MSTQPTREPIADFVPCYCRCHSPLSSASGCKHCTIQPTAPAGEAETENAALKDSGGNLPTHIIQPSESTDKKLRNILVNYHYPQTYPALAEQLYDELQALISEQTTKARIDELQWLLDNHRQFKWEGPNHAEPNANILKRRIAKLNAGDAND